MDQTRAFHRSALRVFSTAVVTARATARHFRAPVVLLDADRAVADAVWALDAPDAADILSRRGAAAMAEAVLTGGHERATRVVVLSRQGASLWLADGDLQLIAETWVEIADAPEERTTEPTSSAA